MNEVIVSLTEELSLCRDIIATNDKELVTVRQQLMAAQSDLDSYKTFHDIPATLNILEVCKKVASTRRDYKDMRLNTEIQLERIKQEMVERSREMATECLEVFKSSQYILSENGEKKFVGTAKDLWGRIEKSQLEKKMIQDKADQFEIERDQALREMETMEKQIDELTIKINEKDEKVELNENVEQRSKVLDRIKNENRQLMKGLNDIALILETEKTYFASLNITDDSSYPQNQSLYFSSRPRDTRFHELRMVKETVLDVQEAFHKGRNLITQLKRQLEIAEHKLENVLTCSQEWEKKNKETTKKLHYNKGVLATAEKELTMKSDFIVNMQANIDELSKELIKSAEKLKIARENEGNLKMQITEEKFKSEHLSRECKTLSDMQCMHEKEMNLKTETLQEKDERIMELVKECGVLKEEIIELKEWLEAVEIDQNRLEMERTDKEITINDEKRIRNQTVIEITELRKHEQILKAKIEEQISFENKLKGDISNNDITIQTLKAEILNYETRLGENASNMSNLQSEVSDQKRAREELNEIMRNLRREKDDINCQLTSISLKKDALEDENVHIREEYQNLKDQNDMIHGKLASIAESKEKLIERLTQKEREIKEMENLIEQYKINLENEAFNSDDWRLQFEGMVGKNNDLTNENEIKTKNVEQLNHTIVELRAQIFSINKKMSEMQEQKEDEFECKKRKIEKELKKLKEESKAQRKDLEDQMDTLRDKLERKRLEEISTIKYNNKTEKQNMEEEIDYLNQQIQNLKSKNDNMFIIAENNKATAEKLARAGEDLAEEKIRQLTSTIDCMRKEMKSEIKVKETKIQEGESCNSHLQMEISSLKSKLDNQELDHQREKKSLETHISKLTSEKHNFEKSLLNLKEQYMLLEESIEELQRKLSKTQDEKEKIERELRFSLEKMNHLQSEMSAKNHTIQEKILEKHREIDILEMKIEKYEHNELVLLEELKEVKEMNEYNHTNESYQNPIGNTKSNMSDLIQEVDMLKKKLDEVGRELSVEKQDKKELENKLTISENNKTKLEKHLTEIKDNIEIEFQAKHTEFEGLQRSLGILRDRERVLENVRHQMELELINKNQEHKDLMINMVEKEGKIKEMEDVISKLEISRSNYEKEIGGVHQILCQIDNDDKYRTTTRKRLISGSSYSGEVLDHNTVLTKLLDLIKMKDIVQNEKNELTGKLEVLKVANENLVLNTGRLEEEKMKTEEQHSNCKLQLNKLEIKVSVNDENLAKREESIERLKDVVKEGERKFREMTTLHNQTIRKLKENEEKEIEWGTKMQRIKEEKKMLQSNLEDIQEELNRYDREKRLMNEERNRMIEALQKKDNELEVIN